MKSHSQQVTDLLHRINGRPVHPPEVIDLLEKMRDGFKKEELESE